MLVFGLIHFAWLPLCAEENAEFEIPKTGAFLPLKARCEGREFYCTLDTGSLETAIDEKSDYLYGSLIQINQGDPRSNTKKSEVREGLPFKLGNYSLPADVVTVLPLDGMQKALGFNLKAIIGVRQLKATHIYVNNSGGRISILEKVPVDIIERWSRCEIDPKLQGVRVTLELQGKPRQFVVSTAMTDFLDLEESLYLEVVQSNSAAKLNDQSAIYGVETSGKTMQRRAVFQKGYFMGRALAGCPVNSGNENKIGLRWLHQYDYLIDFEGLNLYYRSRVLSHPVDPWVILGVQLSFDIAKHEAVISKLGANSLLQNVGVKEGDRLVTFGNLKESEINFVTLEEEIQKYLGGKLTIEVLKPDAPKPKRFVISLKNK